MSDIDIKDIGIEYLFEIIKTQNIVIEDMKKIISLLEDNNNLRQKIINKQESILKKSGHWKILE